LFVADTVGEAAVLNGRRTPGELVACEPALIAVLDAADFRAVLDELPAVTVPLVRELARDLKLEDDLLREATAAGQAGLSQEALSALIERGLLQSRRRKRSLVRHAAKLAWHTLIEDPALKPSFWMFTGVLAALLGARTVVAYIIEHGLQKQLFALVESRVGHPIHVHHFNYGLLITGAVGLLSMAPAMRRYLRALAFAFGFGLGLVVDEFALFWNLNPDYYQPQSKIAAALVVFVLVQVVYFYKLYTALGKRVWAQLAGR
jgi:hypothetical protein